VLETTTLPATRLHHATVGNLLPNSSYLVSVTARSLLVHDAPTRAAMLPANVTASTQAAPGGPWAVRALKIGPDFVAMTWLHAALASAPAVTHFRLHFNATGKGHGGMNVAGRKVYKTFVSLGPSAPGAGGLVCSGLLSSSEYVVSVAACGRGGCRHAAALTIWTAPYAPQGLAVSTLSDSAFSISLHWNAPCARSADGNPARPDPKGKAAPVCASGLATPLDVRYRVSYRTIVTDTESRSEWSEEAASDNGGAATTKTLSALQIGSVYQARLVAVFSGMRSEPVFVTAQLTGSPRSVEAFGVADDAHLGILGSSVTLRWNPPSSSAVSLYKLSWAKVTSSLVGMYQANGGGLGSTQSGVVEIDMRQYNQFANGSGVNYYPVTGLSQHETYSFRIQARNLNGLGYEAGLGCAQGSDLTLVSDCITASPVRQPRAVQHLRVTAATASVIQVEWLPPAGAEAAFRDSLVFRVSRASVVGDETGEEVELAGSLALPTSGLRVLRHRDETGVDGVVYRYRVQARNKNSLGFEAGSTVLATRLTTTCVPSDASCSVSRVRAVAFAGRENPEESGVGIVVEWDPPPGLFAGQVQGQYYYRILASTAAEGGWGDANDQSAFGTTLAGASLGDLAPGTHRALIVNGLGAAVNKQTPLSFLVQARNLNCDGACSYPDVSTDFNSLNYFGTTQGPVLSTQFRWQPSPLGQVAVKITSKSSVTLSWSPIPSSLEDPLFMAKCRIAGNQVHKSVLCRRLSAAIAPLVVVDVCRGRSRLARAHCCERVPAFCCCAPPKRQPFVYSRMRQADELLCSGRWRAGQAQTFSCLDPVE